MRKIIVGGIRLLSFMVGVGSGLVGLFDPSVGHETNFVCWVCMFTMCYTYALKEQ